MLDDIQIIKLDDKGDHRGSVFQWDLRNFGINYVYAYHRKKGIKSWGHFHKGLNKSRDPERLLMLYGKMKMIFEDLDGNIKEFIIEKGDVLITPKLIFHKYEILEYSIFIEPKIQTDEETPDTFDYKEFLKLKNSF